MRPLLNVDLSKSIKKLKKLFDNRTRIISKNELLESCFCTQLSSLQNTLKAQLELDRKLRIILNG